MRRLMRNRLLAGFVAVAVLVPSVVLATHTFSDVPDGKYYTAAVSWAADNGITTGTSATTFSPDASVTRAQNVTFAHRYDQNIVQPALEDIDTAIDANTTAASTAQTTADAAQTTADTAQTTADGAQTDADTAQTTADVLGDRVDAPGQRLALLQWWQDTITLGNGPYGVAFDGTHIWVANYGDGTVSKIDAASGVVAATITVGNSPSGVAFDGTHIWVANYADDTVSKIAAGTGVVAATITVGDGPWGVAFDGTHIWLTNINDGTVSKIPVG